MHENMYRNIGYKIKQLAILIATSEAICSVLFGLAVMISEDLRWDLFDDSDLGILWGFLICVGGVLVAWASSLVLYGFGELIDKATDIERNTRGDKAQSRVESDKENARIEKLEAMRAQGLITEEEYKQALAKK